MKLSIYLTVLALTTTSIAHAGIGDAFSELGKDIGKFGRNVGGSIEKGYNNAKDAISGVYHDIIDDLDGEKITRRYSNACVGVYREGTLANLRDAEAVLGNTMTMENLQTRRVFRDGKIRALRGLCVGESKDRVEEVQTIQSCVKQYESLYKQVNSGISSGQIRFSELDLVRKANEVYWTDGPCGEFVFKSGETN
ncbi:MAG: hypothetical protein AB7H97_09805 [Pseudobdellovibrionaceae bacterium]